MPEDGRMIKRLKGREKRLTCPHSAWAVGEMTEPQSGLWSQGWGMGQECSKRMFT